MDLYEHQGKRLFADAGLPVLPSWLVATPAEARTIAAAEGASLVVKAQVLSGGRGKAGGIVVVHSADECEAATRRVLGLTVKGRPVVAVLLEQAVAIAGEYYLAITLSRHERGPLLLFSTRGGVDIEEVARETPDALLRLPIDPLTGVHDYQLRDLVTAAGLQGETAAQLGEVVRGLWEVFCSADATLVEVNPLVVTAVGDVVCLDSKVTIDDNALWRQHELEHLREAGDERERRARSAGLVYVSLGGDIGVLGNGAGLVMSTIDLIAAAGGRAADFCDVGGGAQASSIAAALGIILADPRVRVVLVSVFGGITRGDEVARGLLEALSTQAADVHAAAPRPTVVVRLEGNAAAEGSALLADAALPGVEAVAGADAAVARAVELATAARGGASAGGEDAAAGSAGAGGRA